MKKLIKVVILTTISVIFAILLCSCHGAKALEAFETPEEFDYNKTYEITFLAKSDSHASQREIFLKAIADFEKLYPNIKVNLMTETDYTLIDQYVQKNISNNKVPNICVAYPDHVANYIEGENIVVPLEKLIDDEKYGLGGSDLRFDSTEKEEMVSKFLDEGKIGGVQYLMPLMRSTEACYVNVDLVRALGFEMPEILTWDFVFEVCKKALEPVGTNEKGNPIYINGKTIMVPFIYKSTDNMMIQMLKQKGYAYSNEEGEFLMFNDDTKKILYLVADKVKSKELTTFDILNKYPGDIINAGNCIFGIDSTAGATWIGSESPNVEISKDSIVKFELAVTEIPQFDPENPVMISQGPSMCLFNKRDKGEVLASWLFMQYLLTNQVQVPCAMTEGYVPVTLKAQQSEEFTDYLAREGQLDENGSNALYYAPKIAASKLLLRNIENTFITPVFKRSASLRKAAGLLIEETGKSVNRNKTIDDKFFDSLYARVRSLQNLDAVDSDDGKLPELGPMPFESIAMLSGIVVVWAGLGAYATVEYVKKRKVK